MRKLSENRLCARISLYRLPFLKPHLGISGSLEKEKSLNKWCSTASFLRSDCGKASHLWTSIFNGLWAKTSIQCALERDDDVYLQLNWITSQRLCVSILRFGNLSEHFNGIGQNQSNFQNIGYQAQLKTAILNCLYVNIHATRPRKRWWCLLAIELNHEPKTSCFYSSLLFAIPNTPIQQ